MKTISGLKLGIFLTSCLTWASSAQPVLLSQPQKQRVVDGGIVGFSINATGAPPLAYQWQHNDVPVPNGTNAVLTLTNITLGNSGVYRVAITNSGGGIVSSNAILEVLPPMELSSVGAWPEFERSKALSVAVNSNYAYLGGSYTISGGFFLVLDISDPSTPILLGHLHLPDDEVLELVVVGNYVYAVHGLIGLSIIDVSNPSQPVIVGSCDTAGRAHGVFVQGDYAYIADDSSGFAVIDVSNPEMPVKVAQVSAPNYTKRVSVAGDYAYLANFYAGISIKNVSDPTNPISAGFLSSGIGWWRVIASGRYLFATSSQGFHVFDISSPTNLIAITNLYMSAWELTIAGNRAYVSGSAGLQIIDISNPVHPIIEGVIQTKNTAEALVVSGDYAFMANWLSGLQVINVANPLQPVWAGELDTFGEGWNLEIAGNLAFLADGGNGLQILDISNPVQPKRLSRYDTPGWVSSVKVRGHFAYVADDVGGFFILNIANPSNPARMGTLTNLECEDLFISGQYAYVAGKTNMQVIDISDPNQPLRVGGTNGFTGCYSIQVVGNYAYLGNYHWTGNTLLVMDLSDPTNPTLVTSVSIPSSHYHLAMAVDENHLYCGKAVFDISNPAQPVKIGEYAYTGGPDVARGYLFLANGSSLRVLDVKDPTLPALVSTTDLPPNNWCHHVKVIGNFAFVASDVTGLKIYSLPTNFISQPMISADPISQTTDAGSDASFTVTAVGQPPLSYQWFFDGLAIADKTNWILILPSVELSQTGNYCVTASNIAGISTSQIAALTVTLPFVIFQDGDNVIGFDSSNRFNLAFRGYPGTNYVVEYINDLGDTNWITLTNVMGTGLPLRVQDNAPADPSRFYRVRRISTVSR